jgi:hypothetical protein
MTTSKKSELGIGISGVGIAGLLLLLCLSILFPIVTTGLSNGNVYTGLLAFLMMHGIEPVYWLLCAATLSGGCVLLFDKSVKIIKKVGLGVLIWEGTILLLYFTNGFVEIQLPEIIFFSIWLFTGLAGIIFPIFALINKKSSKLVPVIFILGMVIMGLGGFMRLFLTM